MLGLGQDQIDHRGEGGRSPKRSESCRAGTPAQQLNLEQQTAKVNESTTR